MGIDTSKKMIVKIHWIMMQFRLVEQRYPREMARVLINSCSVVERFCCQYGSDDDEK